MFDQDMEYILRVKMQDDWLKISYVYYVLSTKYSNHFLGDY